MLVSIQRYLSAKAIDLLVSVSIVKFLSDALSLEMNSIKAIFFLFLGFTAIYLLIEMISSKLFKKTLGEGIFSLERTIPELVSTRSTLIYKPRIARYKRWISLILIASFSVLPFYTDQIVDRFGNSVTGFSASNLSWIPYSPADQDWSIEFPTKPSFQEKNLKVPGRDKLKLSEIISEEELLSYSVLSTKIPENLLRWGPNLVMKGALKIFADNMASSKTLYKKAAKYKNHPCLQYGIQQGNDMVVGRLVMIEDTLYKLEVNLPRDAVETEQEKLDKFFSSFVPS
jgi:hypothetical protein